VHSSRSIAPQYIVALLLGFIAGLGSPAIGAPESVRVEGTTVAFELRTVPGGVVQIGDQEARIPELTVGTTEVTWDLYDIYLYGLDIPDEDKSIDGISRPSKPYVPPDRGYGHAGYPAMGMTRHGAVEFCRWLSRKTGDTYRLPTKAEWMYLSSAGGEELGGVWHEDNADYATRPVAKKPANAFGLHDMLGNVAEWVAPEGGERPQDNATAMGGSFLDMPGRCTPTAAQTQDASWNVSDPQIPKSKWWLADCDFVGFRVIREAKTRKEQSE
jgi:formylglycine-generating enzyme required for sulfatase activity